MNNDPRDNLRRKLLRLLLSRAVHRGGEVSSSNVGDKPDNTDGDKGDGGNAQKNGNQEERRLHLKDALVPILEAIVGGGFFALLGEIVDYWGSHGLKIWCTYAGFGAVEFALAHLLVKAFRKPFIWSIAGIVVALEFLTLGIKKDSLPEATPKPSVSPQRIQLHDGESSKSSPVTIFNPADSPVYRVMVKLALDKGVPSESVNIRMEQPEKLFDSGSNLGFVRYNKKSISHPLDGEIHLVVISIPARSPRRLMIRGT